MSLDDDSDKSGIGSVYTLLGFHYLGNISLRHNDEDEKSGGNGSKKKQKLLMMLLMMILMILFINQNQDLDHLENL